LHKIGFNDVYRKSKKLIGFLLFSGYFTCLNPDEEGKVGIKGVLIDRNNSYPNYKNRITSLTEIYKFLE